jgi:hypothetical protein
MMVVPESASEITVDWLRHALPWPSSGCEPISIEVEPNFGGPSLLGRIARVKLTYAEQGCQPSSLIVKFQALSSDWEASIYRDLSGAGSDSVPQLYGAFEHGTLVLEDLSPARPGSQVEGCSLQQARQVLSLLADVHGRFWGDLQVPSLEVERFASVLEFNMGQCWEPFRRKYRSMLDDKTADFEWAWHNAKRVSAHRLSEPSTLFHGDVHTENLLFSPDGSRSPVLIDWQLAGQGLAANDISFFLVKSLAIEDRRSNENQLLRHYYGLLPEHVQSAYGFDRFYLDYRACVTRSMMSAVMLVGPRFADRPDRFELADVLATRVIAAVQDHRPVAALQALGEDG